MIGSAILLPLLIFLGLQFAFSARDQRSAVAAEALVQSERILVEVDAILQRTLGALEVLATAQVIESRDWPAVYQRLARVRRTNSQWVTAVVVDRRSGQALLDLRRPFGAPVTATGFAPSAPFPPRSAPFVGNIGGSGPGCPCVLVHLPLGSPSPTHVLTVALDPTPFQRILLAEGGRDRVFGLVDRHGRFIARSINHRDRLGQLATHYVRDAIASGPQGVYSGRTFEGFVNYSAFSKSRLSGWSAHVAFSRNLLDSPRWRSLAAAAFAALASLLLASVLVAFTLRQLAAGRQVQERLQEAQKMEALGQITGGIAHDFNNLLTPIIGGLEVVARKAQLEGVSQRLLEGALSSARRAAKLTGQLLAFSRRQKMEIGPVDLPRLLEELQPLLAQSVGAGIRIHADVGPDVHGVRSDANQLELALLNLALNARDAMPQGGILTISARAEAARPGAPAMVAIEVRDSGHGMPSEVLRRATEPFFTTKSSGSGTGLGLSQVYGTAHQSGGSIDIASELGAGTVVTMRLPACDLPCLSPREPDAGDLDETGHNRRVILCDDDDLVRSFAARVLDAAGYVVEAVSDGRAAVELARNAEADLLIVDFAMPGMNGAEVAREVRAIRPQLPTLMITGYADTEAVAELASDVPVLRKPFDGGALLGAAAAALAARAPASAP
jgi:signal transduction histidine kinase/ActR/RegA family two-component response regulator